MLGYSQAPAVVASRSAVPAPVAASSVVAPQTQGLETRQDQADDDVKLSETKPVRRSVPLPPDRPFELGSIPGASTPLGRVNNGQSTPVRTTTPVVQPTRERVAAVYFAPTEGFNAVFAGNDPMRQLKTDAFSAEKQKPVALRSSSQHLIAGLFKDKRNAEKLASAISQHGKTDVTAVQINGKTLYRVSAMQFASAEKANAALIAAKASGATDAKLAF